MTHGKVSVTPIPHTYAFIKNGDGNKFMRFIEEWGGIYIGFEGIPLDAATLPAAEAMAKYPEISDGWRKRYHRVLRTIYLMSIRPWNEHIRLVIWNREESRLEIWRPSGDLQPFPRRFVHNLFDNCDSPGKLAKSKEWDAYVKTFAKGHPDKPADTESMLDHLAGPYGARFLPAERIGNPIFSENLYAPIDTLSVLQTLNRNTFTYMTAIDPTGDGKEELSIFGGSKTVFDGPHGQIQESGYGRYVRLYLDGMLSPQNENELYTLSTKERMDLVCATMNPLLIETAAMLFALDVGLVIDSGLGKGRQGIDVVAVRPEGQGPEVLFNRLENLKLSLHAAATAHYLEHGTIAFQCKAYKGPQEKRPARLVDFRPIERQEADASHGIPVGTVMQLATEPEKSGLTHLNGWLKRMVNIVVPHGRVA